jgi:hypothetical protein
MLGMRARNAHQLLANDPTVELVAVGACPNLPVGEAESHSVDKCS